ncbi:MAG: electron transfer flavoprotein subunit alpha/FixB family protein [Chloroflexota bacterium]|nr:electron transfer flavoprotein subunit alpha/FixB family protein [Chloroflexota bacterium]
MTILTFCAVSGDELPRAPLEALAAARQLSDARGRDDVQTLLVGADVTEHGAALIEHGADQVFVVDDSQLELLEEDLLLKAMEEAVDQLSPEVIIFPHDERSGGNVAPRLAYRLKTGIVTDCTGFQVEDDSIRWLRPVYGGKAMAYMTASGPVQLATVRALSFEPLPADPSREGPVQSLDVALEAVSPQVPIVDMIVEEEALEGPSLDRADVIVSGGRGMGDEEGFEFVKELADVLGAAVGGSRPAADTGWVPHSRLVGQTGKIVAPNLYIAVGVSGAPQHMSGAGSSKTIVAINKDEDAPIFRQAHIGVIDEWENVLPTLIDALKEK